MTDKAGETKTTESDELAKRLRAAEERKAQFDARRQEAELSRRVEDAEREAANLDVLEGLIEKHGEIGRGLEALHTSAGMVVVKRPNALHFKRFQELDSPRIADVDKLVRACLVYPDAAKFDAICDELPAVLMQAANLVANLAGVGKGRIEGK